MCPCLRIVLCFYGFDRCKLWEISFLLNSSCCLELGYLLSACMSPLTLRRHLQLSRKNQIVSSSQDHRDTSRWINKRADAFRNNFVNYSTQLTISAIAQSDINPVMTKPKMLEKKPFVKEFIILLLFVMRKIIMRSTGATSPFRMAV